MNEAQLKTIDSYNLTAEQFAESVGKIENYNYTYDFLIDRLHAGDKIADLASGPGQISRYIKDRKNVSVTCVDLSEKMLLIAEKNIPDGTFWKRSIIDFQDDHKYDAVIIGFGLPYINEKQAALCLENAADLIKNGKYLYISFMQGSSERFEKTSFGGTNDFYIHYHDKARIKELLLEYKLCVIREFELEYIETDGSITTDIILIAWKK